MTSASSIVAFDKTIGPGILGDIETMLDDGFPAVGRLAPSRVAQIAARSGGMLTVNQVRRELSVKTHQVRTLVRNGFLRAKGRTDVSILSSSRRKTSTTLRGACGR